MGHRTPDARRHLPAASCILHPASCVLPRHVGAAILCTLLIVSGAHEGWAFGFSVEPARVQVSVPPGKRRGQTLTVRNAKADAAVHLTAYVRDVIYKPDGSLEFPPPKSTEWSCADWIQVIPSELEIPPKSSREVRVSISAPSDAQGGRYAVIFFETGPSLAEKDSITVSFRVGAVVETIVRGTERIGASLKGMAFVAEPQAIRVDVFNDGNVLVRPRGQVRVFDANGKRLRQVELNSQQLGVLPRTLRSFSTELKEPLPAGLYRVRAEVDYGVRTVLVGEHAFEVK